MGPINKYSTFEAVDFDNIELFQPDWQAIDGMLSEQQNTYDAAKAINDLPIDAYGDVDKKRASTILSARDEWMDEISNIFATKGINAGNKALKQMTRQIEKEYTDPNSLVNRIQSNATTLRDSITKVDNWDAPSSVKDSMRKFIDETWQGTLKQDGTYNSYTPEALPEYQDYGRRALELVEKMHPTVLKNFGLYRDETGIYSIENDSKILSDQEIARKIAPALIADPKIYDYMFQVEKLKAYENGITKDNFNEDINQYNNNLQEQIDALSKGNAEEKLIAIGLKGLKINDKDYNSYIKRNILETITQTSKNAGDIGEIYEYGRRREQISKLKDVDNITPPNEESTDEEINPLPSQLLLETSIVSKVGNMFKELNVDDVNLKDYKDLSTQAYSNLKRDLETGAYLNEEWEEVLKASGIATSDGPINPISWEQIDHNNDGIFDAVGINLSEEAFYETMERYGIEKTKADSYYDKITNSYLPQMNQELSMAYNMDNHLKKFNKQFNEEWKVLEKDHKLLDGELFKIDGENIKIKNNQKNYLDLQEALENAEKNLTTWSDREAIRVLYRTMSDTEYNKKLKEHQEEKRKIEERLNKTQEEINKSKLQIESITAESKEKQKSKLEQKLWKDYKKIQDQEFYTNGHLISLDVYANSGKPMDANRVNLLKKTALNQALQYLTSDTDDIFFYHGTDREFKRKSGFFGQKTNEKKVLEEDLLKAINSPDSQSINLKIDQRPTGEFDLYYVIDLTTGTGENLEPTDFARKKSPGTTIMVGIPESQRQELKNMTGVDFGGDLINVNKVERALDQDGNFVTSEKLNNSEFIFEVERTYLPDKGKPQFTTKIGLPNEQGVIEYVELGVNSSYDAGYLYSKLDSFENSARVAKSRGRDVEEFGELLSLSLKNSRINMNENSAKRFANMLYESITFEPYLKQPIDPDTYLNALSGVESSFGKWKDTDKSNAVGEWHVILNNERSGNAMNYADIAHSVIYPGKPIPAVHTDEELEKMREKIKTDSNIDRAVMKKIYQDQLTEANSLIKNTGSMLDPSQVAPLIHFLGYPNALQFLEDYENYGIDVAQERYDARNNQDRSKNKSVQQYMEDINNFAFTQ